MCACCTNHKDDARNLYHLRPNKIGKSAIGAENDINISTIIWTLNSSIHRKIINVILNINETPKYLESE